MGEALVPAVMLESAKPVVQEKVTPRQALRTKIFSTPLLVFPRLEASDEKATYWPDRLMLGCSLKPFAGVTPSAVDIRIVEGVQLTDVSVTPRHVSRT